MTCTVKCQCQCAVRLSFGFGIHFYLFRYFISKLSYKSREKALIMTHEYGRKGYYDRERDRERERDRDRDWNRDRKRLDYRREYEKRRSLSRKRSRSPPRRDSKRRSRTPRKHDKDLLDENILSEISKLPEPSELWDNQMQDGFSAPPGPQFSQEVINVLQ